MRKLTAIFPTGSYNIYIGKGLLSLAGSLFEASGKILIVTDSGVPESYSATVSAALGGAKTVTLPEGEDTKGLECLKRLYDEMLSMEMDRGDTVIAVGGGVVGDLVGFAAATYMRGIRFYNCPTTLLSAVDSSVGGKTAINYGGVKNPIGAFYQPGGVIIDTDCLKTLSKRHLSSGAVEALKMGLTSDKYLFELVGRGRILEDSEEIIERSLKVKLSVVTEDEKEKGIRKILNLGHTLGHGIEAEEIGRLYHGECVALGLIPTVSEKIRSKVKDALEAIGITTSYSGDIDAALSHVKHDKKNRNGVIDVIFADTVGSYRIEKMTAEEFGNTVKRAFGKEDSI